VISFVNIEVSMKIMMPVYAIGVVCQEKPDPSLFANDQTQRKVSLTCARHGLFFATGQRPGSDRNRRMRTRTYGGVAAGAGLLDQSPASRLGNVTRRCETILLHLSF
jgi:hypothetical protein